jgi:hypothetical protein
MSEKPKFQGVWIPKTLWECDQLSLAEKCLITQIDHLADDEAPCFAGSGYLAKFMGMEIGSILNMLSDLTQRGHLIQLGFDGRTAWRCVSPVFTANLGKYRKWLESPENFSLHEKGKAALRNFLGLNSQKCEIENKEENKEEIPPNPLKGGSVRSFDILSEHQKNSHRDVFSEEQKKKKKLKLSVDLVLGSVPPDLTLQSPSFLKAWKAWVENRLQLRNPTLGSFEEHMRICTRLGEARAISAIRHSIASCYLTIYEPKSNYRPDNNRDRIGASL